MEDEPRAIELRGDAIQKVNHAYGTNGVITEVEMPLAPAYPWVDLIVGFDDLMTAVRFADALARQDGLVKKLITPLAAPIAELYFRPLQSRIPHGQRRRAADDRRALDGGVPRFPRRSGRARSCSSARRATPGARACRSTSCPGTTPRCTRCDRPDGHLSAGPLPAARPPRAGREDVPPLRRRGDDPPRVRPLRGPDRLLRPADRALHERRAPGRDHPPTTRTTAARSSTRTPSRSRRAA